MILYCMVEKLEIPTDFRISLCFYTVNKSSLLLHLHAFQLVIAAIQHPVSDGQLVKLFLLILHWN